MKKPLFVCSQNRLRSPTAEQHDYWAAFEFVVSDLTKTENMRIAHALLPGVQRHIKESETGV
jgi:predicted protein tyrosine phosphatase